MAATTPDRIDPNRLTDFCTAVYASAGVPRMPASSPNTPAQADLWGHQSTACCGGLHFARIRAGMMQVVTKPEFVVDAGAVAVIDGHDGVGQVLTALAAREAIKRAKAHGIGAVGVRNSIISAPRCTTR